MSDKINFEKLLEPLKIKNVTLKNRIVKPATWLVYPDDDGTAGDRVKAHYKALAKGGVGLITIEESTPDYPMGASNWPHIRLDDDRFIPSLTELAEVIHEEGCPVFVQITHAGPAHSPDWDGFQPMAPSAIDPPAEAFMAVSREMSVSEIEELVEKFAQAALRVKKAGFDGVEIHGAHYALLNAFLSRYQNKRLDEYGCETLENRARFPLEILERTRELVGDDFVVGIRMNAREWGPDTAITLEEGVEFARMFEAAGADFIQSSGYGYGIYDHCALPDLVLYPEIPESAGTFADSIPSGALIPAAAAVKRAVSIPVGGVGKLSPEAAEQALKEGAVDMVCMARGLLADPDLPNKIMDGRVEDIRPCLGSSSCLYQVAMGVPIACGMNPFLGNEREMVVEPAIKKKNVMIIGAGPAGMESARMAAERGHHVTLYDQADSIGGRINRLALIKGTAVENYTGILTYYETQLNKLGVVVKLNTEVDDALVSKISPDAVIIANGGLEILDDIPGIDRDSVISTDRIGPDTQFDQRVVVIGGNYMGLNTAIYLAKQSKDVTILEKADEPGEGMIIFWMAKALGWLAQHGIPIVTGVQCQKIIDNGVIVTNSAGEEINIEADTVVFVSKHQKDEPFFNALEGKVPEIHLIEEEDKDEMAYFGGAVHNGAKVGMLI